MRNPCLAIALVAAVLLVIGCPGCTHSDGTHDDRFRFGRATYAPPPDLTAAHAATLSHDMNKWNIVVLQVDGKWDKEEDRGFARLLTGGGELLIRPGIHTLLVAFNDDYKRSTALAELSVPLELGHHYHIQNWPPTLVDETTGFQVPMMTEFVARY